MKKVVKASMGRYSKRQFVDALKRAVDIYYSLEESDQLDIDESIGEDFIIDLEDSMRALSID